ncbi:angiopoietin-related protein 7-like [Xenia sp. Carnegie-2017]|uniref:angiopoietin-related protein 7-like n=1 Tax=Xenia sp. Carnegie-2017 TaxID=2897299 RepID=UPI001F034231|nr:angiopoietin-related protein 7-like [Xenia sp. Carnegie-2017]
MVSFICALVAITCIVVNIQGVRLTNEKEDVLKDFYSKFSHDMKRAIKSDENNATLKSQIAVIDRQIKTLQTYHKNLQTEKKHLQTFKLILKHKINRTEVQKYTLVKLQQKIKKVELKMIDLSSQMKKLDAQMATLQTELKSLEKQLKTLYMENEKLTNISEKGKDCADLYRKSIRHNGIYMGKNCADLYKKGKKKNGVYQIDPDGQGYFDVFCDMKTSGGGWTVFQRRQDGSVDFYRNWKNYTQGFGNLTFEFWLGLDKIYRLTSAKRNKLRVDLGDWSGNKAYAEYDYFAVKNETHKYQLSLGAYSGESISKYKHLMDKFLSNILIYALYVGMIRVCVDRSAILGKT